jgi:cell wall-associated NlpC family hydrolase
MRKVISAALVAAAFTLAMPSNAQAATLKSKAASIAANQINDPYQWGAEGPHRFDCSGLVYYSYKNAGKTLRRTAQEQYNASYKIPSTSRQVGDLVFIGTSTRNIYHVGIYAGWKDGKGWMWNANTGSYRGRKVVKAPISEYTAGSPRAYYGQVR